MSEETVNLEKLVSYYKAINNSSLDRNHLICNKCNSWLNEFIYLIKDGTNVCAKCSETIEGISIRNRSLENLLRDTKFPCKYIGKGCTIYYKSVDIKKHEPFCNYRSCACFCEAEAKDKNDLLEHVLTHKMKTITLTKPLVKIDNCFEKSQLFQLNIGVMTMYVALAYDSLSNIIQVAMLNATNYQKKLKYLIKWSSDNMECKKHCVAYDNSFIFDPTYNIDASGFKQQIMPLRIYFGKFEQIEPFDGYFRDLLQSHVNYTLNAKRCCRCNIRVEKNVYICQSASHIFCSNCINGLCTACPGNNVEILTTKIWTINNFPQDLFQKPCENASRGCFMYGTISEMQAHKLICPMRINHKCDICQKDVAILSFTKHLINVHVAQILHNNPDIIKPGLITYNGVFVQFNFQYEQERLGVTKCTWSLNVVYTPYEKTLYDYTLKICSSGETVTINNKTQWKDDKNILYFQHKFEGLPKFTLSLY